MGLLHISSHVIEFIFILPSFEVFFHEGSEDFIAFGEVRFKVIEFVKVVFSFLFIIHAEVIESVVEVVGISLVGEWFEGVE